jgi:hypothetical protein
LGLGPIDAQISVRCQNIPYDLVMLYLWPSVGEDYFIEPSFTLWYFKYVNFKIKIKIMKDEQKYTNNKNKRICSAKFGFIQKAASFPPLH